MALTSYVRLVEQAFKNVQGKRKTKSKIELKKEVEEKSPTASQKGTSPDVKSYLAANNFEEYFSGLLKQKTDWLKIFNGRLDKTAEDIKTIEKALADQEVEEAERSQELLTSKSSI